MAEAAAATVAWLTSGEVVLTAVEAYAIATAVELVAVTAYNNYSKRRARDKMRQAHNSSLRDRYVMGRSTITERRIILGRQRVSGNLSFLKSYGANLSKIVGVLPLSAEEIDAVEAVYFDDEQVLLDGAGIVTGVLRRELFSISSASDTFTLQSAPKAGTVSAVASYGSSNTTLTVSVSGSNVTVSGASATLSGQVTISYQPETVAYVPSSSTQTAVQFTTNGSGGGSVTLPSTPISGTVKVVRYDNWIEETDSDATSLISVSGNVVTMTGGQANQTYMVNYQAASASRAKIRVFRGQPGQVADAALIAALPGVWTSAHVGNGIAYLVFELDFDPEAFPSSLPNVSALVRGSKVYDPRTGLTAWSENPALLARHVALHPLGGRLSAGAVNDDAVITAANVCDTTTAYVVGGRTYTRPRYTASLVMTSGTRADDVIQDLCEAMGGERWFTEGQLVMKAGAWVTPTQTLDETWLMREGSPVQTQRRRPRDEVVNITTGAFADEMNDFQVRDYPPVRSSLYISEDGEELPEDFDLNAVTFTGQAQQIVAQRMRRKRFGRRISLTCNYRAFAVQVGDPLYVNLPTRFNFQMLPVEVLSVTFTIDGGISLVMEEIGPEIWAVSANYAEVPLPPNVFSPSPLEVPAVAGLTVTRTAAENFRAGDGTLLQRLLVEWTPTANPTVLAPGGGTEVRYGSPGWSENQWISVKVESPVSRVFLDNLRQGMLYLVKARHYNALLPGRWTVPTLQIVNASLPSFSVESTSGFTGESSIAATYGIGTYFSLGVYGLTAFTLTAQAVVTVTCSFTAEVTNGASASTVFGSFFLVVRNSRVRYALQAIREPIAASASFSQKMRLSYAFTLPAGTYYSGVTVDGRTGSFVKPVPGDVFTEVNVRYV